ncbi:STAS domain-containing protein [Nonomuraea angiospora]|uniref:Anti-sigma factor antagonist n=1 Tax=Nonomuraea angiospora TaxID=46172 RepID=A0ABR9LNI8_9ACTN|nr:STAS domain-containing protein [Nonomuraea angiospora]MBE1582167.1 anti-anti-sigma factor [Nonomuraea angiospora]
MSEKAVGRHAEDLAARMTDVTPLHLSGRALIGGTLIEVAGEVDAATAPQLTAYIEREHPDAGLALVLDLSGVSFMDSSGLHLLVEQHNRQAEHGSGLHVAAPHERVRRLLEITGVGQVLHTHSTLDQALLAADLIDPMPRSAA